MGAWIHYNTSNWSPRVDIKEGDDSYLFIEDIPAFEPKEIELTTEKDLLIIKGERRSEHEKSAQGFKHIECSYGSLSRRFALPDNADTSKIKAQSKNGVLEVSEKKVEHVKSKRIKPEIKKSQTIDSLRFHSIQLILVQH